MYEVSEQSGSELALSQQRSCGVFIATLYIHRLHAGNGAMYRLYPSLSLSKIAKLLIHVLL